MALEKECDIVLYELSEVCERDAGFAMGGATYEDLIRHRQVVANNETIKNNWGSIICILEEDGNIQKLISKRQDGGHSSFKMTKKGIAFLATDSYEKRKSNSELLFELTLSNAYLAKKSLVVNRWIALATVAAAIYYMFQMFDFYQTHFGDWVRIAYLVTGLAIGVGLQPLIRSLWGVLRKTNTDDVKGK